VTYTTWFRRSTAKWR